MCAQFRKNGILTGWVTGAVADGIFRRLETKPNQIQSKRVERILELLSRLGKNNGDWAAFTQLREPLKKYKWHYGLVLGRGGLSARLDFTREMSEADEWEHKAVRFLQSLVPHQLNRLRRCAYDGCKGWFFAEKHAGQRFCKRGACRQKFYESNPDVQEKKRVTMRENRRKKKERDARNDKRFGYAPNRGLAKEKGI
jgi:hypothetical protein